MSTSFTPKRIIYDKEMIAKLDEGMRHVHDAVGRTMGPSGQLVMFEDEQNLYPVVTKDGVTVASMIAFKDEALNNGAQFVIQAARKQVQESGDGTTLTSIMSYKFFKEGRKLLDGGYSQLDMINGMRDAITNTVKRLKHNAKKINSVEDLKCIARVSANNDSIGDKIAEAVYKTGLSGMVGYERAKDDKHSIEYQEGYKLETGVIGQEFLNSKDGRLMALSKPYILVTNQTIVDAGKLMPLIKKIKEKEPNKKPQLIIVAPTIGGDVYQVLSRNITDPEGLFFGCHVMPSQSLEPEKNRVILEDIAALSGGFFVSEGSGYKIDQIEIDKLGTCDSVLSHPGYTLFRGFNKKTAQARIQFLKEQNKMEIDEFQKALYKQSIARLGYGVAVVKVGGKTQSEQMESMFRVEDAILACKAAMEEGYVRGGGVALLEILRELNYGDVKSVSESYENGYYAGIEALSYPAQMILTNAKRDDWLHIIKSITSKEQTYLPGYNIKTGEYVDMYELNIYDPTKVIICGLKNALSVAISVLNSSVMILKEGV